MRIILQDFVGMAMDDIYNCYIRDNEKKEQVFSCELADILEDLLYEELSSWEIDNGIIGFNIN